MDPVSGGFGMGTDCIPVSAHGRFLGYIGNACLRTVYLRSRGVRISTMRVAFNARILSGPTIRGWNRYTVNLLANLPAFGAELFLFSDTPLHPAHLEQLPAGSYHVRVAPGLPYFAWEQWWLPRQCAADRVDILHSPFNFGLPWRSRCPRVLTLHDAIGQFDWRFDRNAFLHWASRTRADKVITVSEYSKQDLVGHLNIPEDKVVAIHEAADSRFGETVPASRRAAVRDRHGLIRPYVLYVGGWEERKNPGFLVDAFGRARLDGVDLVLAGGLEEQRSKMAEYIGELGLSGSVRLLGWVDDGDLPALYSEALCFVYPSRYEGFGLQLCEAMAAGCPTLAANATCLPEVLGAGGELFDLGDASSLSKLLVRVAGDEAFRSQLQQRARRRAQDFSWAGTAEQTLGVYQQLLAG